MSAALQAALELHAIGINILPIKTDGSKAPSVRSWDEAKTRLYTAREIQAMHTAPCGLAAVCGAVSGNLLALDFDDPNLYAPFCTQVSDSDPNLLGQLVHVKTPRGYCLFTRHDGEPISTKKLAEKESRQGRKTLIETRSEGAYEIIPPTPGACHPTGLPYRYIHRSLVDVATITSDDIHFLLDTACSFNEVAECVYTSKIVSTQPMQTIGTRPGDLFNAQADWHRILEPHGWAPLYCRGPLTGWRRPGKSGRGGSATTNFAETNLLYVFSSNAAPFDGGTAYTAFSAYALLNHQGDFRSAARYLADQGYHTDTRRVPAPRRPQAIRLETLGAPVAIHALQAQL